MLAIARLNLLELVRDRGELVGVIVLPLMLTWVFGTAFGSQGIERALEVPVADLDGSRYSRQVVELLDATPGFDAAPTDEDEARTLVADGDSPVALVIPKGFGAAVESGEEAVLETVRAPGAQNGQAVVEVVEGAAARVAANAEAARAVMPLLAEPVPAAPMPAEQPSFEELYDLADGYWEPEPPVGVSAERVAATKERAAELEAPSNTQYSLGFTVFFVFMTALGSAGGVLEDRELGTLRRILAAPARRFEILGGKVLGVAAVSAFEAAILVGMGALVFRVPWGADPLAVGLVLLSLVLAATGLGVMVSALVRTRGQMSALGPVLSTALAMLGGCYWPLEITTPFMQQLARFTPTGWAMIGLKDVVARGGGLEAALLPSGILLAFAAVAIGVGVTRLRLE
jgi:ABC-2 type transport system permease protein